MATGSRLARGVVISGYYCLVVLADIWGFPNGVRSSHHAPDQIWRTVRCIDGILRRQSLSVMHTKNQHRAIEIIA